MCGRFVQSHDPEFYADAFGVETIRTESLPTSFNVAPTDSVYAVAEHDGERLLGAFRWGLIPFWAKDKKIGARNINARSETAADKPAFRDSFSKRRCLIPADGFYEWQRRPDGKLPHYIYRADSRPVGELEGPRNRRLGEDLHDIDRQSQSDGRRAPRSDARNPS